MVDAADFTTAGAEGPRMEISDQATLHLEDTTPEDIVSGPSGTPVVATPVKSMWQTDRLYSVDHENELDPPSSGRVVDDGPCVEHVSVRA